MSACPGEGCTYIGCSHTAATTTPTTIRVDTTAASTDIFAVTSVKSMNRKERRASQKNKKKRKLF